jgi:glycosyltransferase involved in cell wall biosynthesis
MRYLWDLYHGYLHEWTKTLWKRAALAALSCPLRMWDYASAARVDQFVANSRNVRQRIWKTYRRQAQVVYPPVDVDRFHWSSDRDYYLVVSELVAYKRIEDAVCCASRTGRRLKIVGEGPEYRTLSRQANANVEFCGRVPRQELLELYARCRALLMPGEEDFGIVAVEAMASGKPVVALGRGGAREGVAPEEHSPSGVFYDSPDEASLGDAIRRFEQIEHSVNPLRLQAWAAGFSPERFLERMRQTIGLESPPLRAEHRAAGAVRQA